jgi:aconitate hydratase
VRVDGQEITTILEVSERQRQNLLAGGTLNQLRQELKGGG